MKKKQKKENPTNETVNERQSETSKMSGKKITGTKPPNASSILTVQD